MKKRVALSALCLVLTLSSAFFVSCGVNEREKKPECYVGVSFCGNTTAEAKLLIDRIKEYTNLLVLQSGPISENETATNEICDYAVDAGLSFIMFFGDLTPHFLRPEHLWRLSWLDYAKATINSDSIASSLPHRKPEERKSIASCFVGVTTWQLLCREFGIDWKQLPDFVHE